MGNVECKPPANVYGRDPDHIFASTDWSMLSIRSITNSPFNNPGSDLKDMGMVFPHQQKDLLRKALENNIHNYLKALHPFEWRMPFLADMEPDAIYMIKPGAAVPKKCAGFGRDPMHFGLDIYTAHDDASNAMVWFKKHFHPVLDVYTELQQQHKRRPQSQNKSASRILQVTNDIDTSKVIYTFPDTFGIVCFRAPSHP